MLCWWYWDNRLRAMGGKPFSGFTDRGINKDLGLHQHSQVFQTCHILGIGDKAGWVLGQGYKSVCSMKNIQHISSIFWQCYTLMKEITPRVGMEELQGLAELCSKLFRNHISHGLKFLSTMVSPWRIIPQVMQVGDGKDNHTCPLFWGRLYGAPDECHGSSRAYTCISFFMLTQRHGYTCGPIA